MTRIHPTAVVSSTAHVGQGVEIGPLCIVEDDVVLGDGCRLEGRVTIKRATQLGPENYVAEGAVLGGLPQHLHCPPRPGRVVIGARNTIREHVTIHRAMEEQAATVIGDGNLLMVNVHIAHDCVVGNQTIMANNVMLAGHVVVQDRAYLSGAVAVHQRCRVGSLAMVGGAARILKDVPPFVTLDGGSGGVVGLNLIGLRRAGFSDADIAQLKAAYRVIYRSGLTWEEVLRRLHGEFTSGPAARMVEFLTAASSRGVAIERRMPRGATVPMPTVESAQEEERTLRVKAG